MHHAIAREHVKKTRISRKAIHQTNLQKVDSPAAIVVKHFP